MKKNSILTWNFPLLAALILILVSGCKKENDFDVTDIDGNGYHIVTVGNQEWLKENLKTTKLNDGTAIKLEPGNSAWESLTVAGYCWYDNDPSKGNIYGALYNYIAVASGKLCPTGWHVPSKAEWETLRDNAGGEAIAGGNLKEKGTVHWNSPNTGATDQVGFTALPGGERYEDGRYFYLGENNNFWSTTPGPSGDPFGVRMYHDGSDFHMSEFMKEMAISVRCIKN